MVPVLVGKELEGNVLAPMLCLGGGHGPNCSPFDLQCHDVSAILPVPSLAKKNYDWILQWFAPISTVGAAQPAPLGSLPPSAEQDQQCRRPGASRDCTCGRLTARGCIAGRLRCMPAGRRCSGRRAAPAAQLRIDEWSGPASPALWWCRAPPPAGRHGPRLVLRERQRCWVAWLRPARRDRPRVQQLEACDEPRSDSAVRGASV